MAIRRPPSTFSDELTASDLAANSVTASELADNAVDSDAIAANAVVTAKITDANITAAKLNTDVTDGSAITTEVKPHIIPGVLYPAIGGKGIDGTTTVSSFGTDVSISGFPTLKYYYTDIKGSKPIKDPRIGAHFGSQRHKFKSLQLLEQETATHGKNVYSVDGREWVRCVDGSNGWNARYDIQGNCVEVNLGNLDGTDFIEITGYFNFANVSTFTNADHQNQTSIFLNGTDTSNDLNAAATVVTPLLNRHVDPGGLIDLNLGTVNTPGINTIKLTVSDSSSSNRYALFYAIELIAQDTTSDANKLKIQIPAQNVVSFGKKLPISATADHYDPFNGFTSGNLAAVQALGIDTATSLGLSKWLPSDAATTYYRPFNGGRVVKWVNSSGVIKTSVNMMPPNAKSIANSASPTNAFATRTTASHFGTNNAMNSFEAGTELDSAQLSEVATSLYAREFGNGSANGDASFKDISTVTSDADAGFVMDDGLTSMSGSLAYDTYQSVKPHSTNSPHNITFIGTGLTLRQEGNTHTGIHAIAQNLPFGTHILSAVRNSTANNTPYKLDGVQLFTGFLDIAEVTIHQPKKPPIPEDAVVLCDYMLMADHVNKTSHTNGVTIGKGVRLLDSSRDIYHDTSSGSMLLNNASIPDGYPFRNYMNSGSGAKISRIQAFGTSFGIDALASVRGKPQVNGSDVLHTDRGSHVHINSAVTLGNNLFGWQAETSQDGGFFRFEIATPIHTSHHYQPFETPFLHEVVGGDRNMEQTNLVVSSDGKTWDEVTRDTSYIGNVVVSAKFSADRVQSWGFQIPDDHRGKTTDGEYLGNKDFAIAYDRFVCLKEGHYNITRHGTAKDVATPSGLEIYINDSIIQTTENYSENSGGWRASVILSVNAYLKRGDTVRVRSYNTEGDTLTRNLFDITRL